MKLSLRRRALIVETGVVGDRTTEITSGLEEGDEVVRQATTSTSTDQQGGFPGGFRIGGDGTTVTVTTTSGTSVQVTRKGGVADLAPGGSIVVRGERGTDGTIEATAVTQGGR
ncbi:hypothetical protein [Spongiactinospora sp. TRM90649]|uniref:hypothetical protein n=1 Tax=Spongiactinospora sp. TRM90649 TaxID=3031114 RepID=UPI0023F70D72|nr:hypothetical protein [Spongiactinospora sp. TRM90649]MDF5757788.1 hypothetical protein [Spongiactinospora sp. TRM90649]